MMPDNPLFFAFTIVALAAYVAVPPRWRWPILLVASIGFYGSFLSVYLLLTLAVVTLVTFVGARAVEQVQGSSAKLVAFSASVSSVIAILVGAKLLPIVTRKDTFVATIGVSYYTIQSIGYLADVYWGRYGAERSLGRIALFLAFFPKLLQGPIERGNEFLPQLQKLPKFSYAVARPAALRIALGLFKKVVVADRLGLYVQPAFAEVHAFSGPVLLFATYAFALQIYIEFSGYTDIAIGVGKLFGVRLEENFRHPYEAESVAEFWRRWHMSLTRWLLDYLFRPLQLVWRRWGLLGTTAAIFSTFLLSGLWHGLQWTFLAWGALHGAYLAAGMVLKQHRSRWQRSLGGWARKWLRVLDVAVTFNLVCLAWIFFRAQSIGDARWIITHLSIGTSGLLPYVRGNGGMFNVAVSAFGMACLILVRVAGTGHNSYEAILERPRLIRWSTYTALALSIGLLGTGDLNRAFIYVGF